MPNYNNNLFFEQALRTSLDDAFHFCKEMERLEKQLRLSQAKSRKSFKEFQKQLSETIKRYHCILDLASKEKNPKTLASYLEESENIEKNLKQTKSELLAIKLYVKNSKLKVPSLKVLDKLLDEIRWILGDLNPSDNKIINSFWES